MSLERKTSVSDNVNILEPPQAKEEVTYPRRKNVTYVCRVIQSNQHVRKNYFLYYY